MSSTASLRPRKPNCWRPYGRALRRTPCLPPTRNALSSITSSTAISKILPTSSPGIKSKRACSRNVMLPVVWLPEAGADLMEARAWYDRISSDLGERFALAVEATVEAIALHSLQFPVIHRGRRRGGVRRFPYGIFFDVQERQILVIACFHGAQSKTLAVALNADPEFDTPIPCSGDAQVPAFSHPSIPRALQRERIPSQTIFRANGLVRWQSDNAGAWCWRRPSSRVYVNAGCGEMPLRMRLLRGPDRPR
jgi:plasmid stabilization system protein ParE